MRGSDNSGCCWQVSGDHLKRSQHASHVACMAPDRDAGVAAAEGTVMLAGIYALSFIAADLSTPAA